MINYPSFRDLSKENLRTYKFADDRTNRNAYVIELIVNILI